MDLKAFFNSLSNSEKVELDNIVRDWNLKTAEAEAEKIVLNNEDKKFLVNGDRIGAIKNIKDRYNCTLIVAKIAVDNYLDSLTKDLVDKVGVPCIKEGEVVFTKVN